MVPRFASQCRRRHRRSQKGLREESRKTDGLPGCVGTKQNDFSFTNGKKGDGFLFDMLEEQGFNNKAHVVTDLQLNEFIKNGEIELHRGIDKFKNAEKFINDKLYAGHGVFGNGTYTAVGDNSLTDAKQYGKNILRMSLRKEAKIISGEKLDKLQKTVFQKWDDELQKIRREAFRLESEALLEKSRILGDRFQKLKRLYSDSGRFATSIGYDAIKARSDVIIILNRTAVRVSKNIIRVK